VLAIGIKAERAKPNILHATVQTQIVKLLCMYVLHATCCNCTANVADFKRLFQERRIVMRSVDHSAIDLASRIADPLADNTIAAIIGSWPDGKSSLDAAALERIVQVNRLMATWDTNASLQYWQAPPDTDADLARTLQAYLLAGSALPEWADQKKVERAETIFIEDGPLSCTLLFCASLPECYVLPNLADVLHIAGQLEAHTEHRIRQTAAMIFPVMMRGGLMGLEGQGLAQVLKVRLIHATIRHLILRGNPEAAKSVIPVFTSATPPTGMHDALMRYGWDVDRQGLPCNQTELAYTLLTFGYVFLKGLRTLGQGLSASDEQAYLHTWNVMGHMLGIRSEFMAHSMAEAEQMFARMQAQARAKPPQIDVRPALGQALINAMARTLAVPIIRSLPVPMTQWLVGKQTAQDIGLAQLASWPTRVLFVVLRSLVRGVDTLGRVFTPHFSISRMITRIMGYHLLTQLLMNQTRPLALPDKVLQNMYQIVALWGHDPKALSWLNRWEDRLTCEGPWQALPAASSRPPLD
jgi:ER-bound oxygenase mpaB/B'/Rubber oxygenase, catalytic domain